MANKKLFILSESGRKVYIDTPPVSSTMTFKLIRKRAGVRPRNPTEVAVTKNGFSVGNQLTKGWEEYSSAEVYIDSVEKQVGFRPTNNTISGFKFNKTGITWTLQARAASKRVPMGTYDAKVENGMIVFSVPKIAKEEY